MNQQRAKQIAFATAFEALPTLHKAMRFDLGITFQRMALTSLRDLLHGACRMFEEGQAAEIFEEEYLPLFDSLALVTDAIRWPHKQPELLAAMFLLLETISSGSPFQPA